MKKNNVKEIDFIAYDEYSANVKIFPEPMSKHLPYWYKNESNYEISHKNPNGNKMLVDNYHTNGTFKKCMPVKDPLFMGYAYLLFADVQIRTQHNDDSGIFWKVSEEVFSFETMPSTRRIPPPPGFGTTGMFRYRGGFNVKTPPGYSIMVTHPMGYHDLPFRTIPAIIDSDKNLHGIEPMIWLKDGIEDIVPKGTPIAQIIPFKRDDWKSNKIVPEGLKNFYDLEKTYRSYLKGIYYIKNVWSRKTFR